VSCGGLFEMRESRPSVALPRASDVVVGWSIGPRGDDGACPFRRGDRERTSHERRASASLETP
jgi:hypothetical protein